MVIHLFKAKNISEEMKVQGNGDAWKWVGIHADSKLVVSWYVGDRSVKSAIEFMCDLKTRVTKRLQLTTDGHHTYLEAVADYFCSQIDFAPLVKIYGGSKNESNKTERKYSPANFLRAEKHVRSGNPDESLVSTSYVERQNLTMSMPMRRFTHLIKAFSNKIENHCYAIALHFVHYNFVRQHKTIRITPAMAAGITKRFIKIEDVAAMINYEVPKVRGTYKMKAA